jgi:hypothetical protein
LIQSQTRGQAYSGKGDVTVTIYRTIGSPGREAYPIGPLVETPAVPEAGAV